MKTLDLHGVKHSEVDISVENFILLNQGDFPLKIICGNSAKMIDLVNKTIDRLGANTVSLRYGIITVTGFR